MRSFNYINDYNLLSTTVRGYIRQLQLEISYLKEIDNNPVYVNALKILEEFNNKFPDLNVIRDAILDDLLAPENFEYCFKNGKYPDNSSKIGMDFENEIKKIFVLEENLRAVAVESWKNKLTKFENIVNGDDFMIVGHASSYLPGTPDFVNYRENKYNRQFLSCSLLSGKEFNTFNKLKIVYVVDVNDENYISSSSFDSVTSETSLRAFGTMKEIKVDGDTHYINVGYSYDYNKSVTSISTPDLIEKLSIKREILQNGELFSYDNLLTNEIVLDRTTTKVDGAVLISNGCDLVLREYLFLKSNGINFKCLNKGLYRRKVGLSDYTDKEFNEFILSLPTMKEYLDFYDISYDILIDYYYEVVLPMRYSDEILQIIQNELLKYVDISMLGVPQKR